jgi:hypothetical protein
MRVHRAGGRSIAMAAVLLCVSIAHAHPVEHPWKVTVSRSGGIAGIRTSAALDDSGMLVFPVWTGDEMITVRRQQKPEDIAAVEAELAMLPLSGPAQPPPPGPGCCDQFSDGLVVEVQGRAYPLPPARLYNLVMAMRSAAWTMADVDHARDEFWAKVGPFDPGKVLHVSEESCTDSAGKHHQSLQGSWTRRDHSNTFDLVYPATKSHIEIRDTLTLDSVMHDMVTLTRLGTGQKYVGRRVAKNDRSFDGLVTPPGCGFTSVIDR